MWCSGINRGFEFACVLIVFLGLVSSVWPLCSLHLVSSVCPLHSLCLESSVSAVSVHVFAEFLVFGEFCMSSVHVLCIGEF